MPGYAVKVQSIGIAEGDNLEIRSLLDRQQYADPEGAAALAGISSAMWPLFGQIWPSARLLANLMQAWDLGTCRILEIGCGLALASLVVHRRHGNITASDNHPLAESFLHDNLQRNHLPPMKFVTGDWSCPDPALGHFDLIIGSDVLYERDHPSQLVQLIERHAACAAEVLIIDPNRGNRRGFTQGLQLLGFALKETNLSTTLPDGTAFRGRVLHYHRQHVQRDRVTGH